MTKKLTRDDLLFHAVHGLCRVALITASEPEAAAGYSVIPVSMNRSKVRFTIPFDSFENSGFSKLIKAKEANEVLEYLKSGKKKKTATGATWIQAEMVFTEARNKDSWKDKKKSQRLNHAVKSLVGELAIVLQSDIRTMADKVQDILGPATQINPLIVSAITNIDRD